VPQNFKNSFRNDTAGKLILKIFIFYFYQIVPYSVNAIVIFYFNDKAHITI